MKTTYLSVAALAATLALSCAPKAAPQPPPQAAPVTPPSEGLASPLIEPSPDIPGATTVQVFPPYGQPEFTLGLALPVEADWSFRYFDRDYGQGVVSILRFKNRTLPLAMELVFLPRGDGTPAELAEKIRAGGRFDTPIRACAGVTECAEFDYDTKTMHTRNIVLRLPEMHYSYAVLRVGTDDLHWGEATALFRYIVSRMTATPTPPPTPEAELAQCLTDRGVKLYSQWWCRPCAAQMERFEAGATRIEHIECSDPGEYNVRESCVRDGVSRGFPQWVFPDGEHVVGLQPLELLAKKAGCPWAEPPTN